MVEHYLVLEMNMVVKIQFCWKRWDRGLQINVIKWVSLVLSLLHNNKTRGQQHPLCLFIGKVNSINSDGVILR